MALVREEVKSIVDKFIVSANTIYNASNLVTIFKEIPMESSHRLECRIKCIDVNGNRSIIYAHLNPSIINTIYERIIAFLGNQSKAILDLEEIFEKS